MLKVSDWSSKRVTECQISLTVIVFRIRGDAAKFVLVEVTSQEPEPEFRKSSRTAAHETRRSAGAGISSPLGRVQELMYDQFAEFCLLC